MQDKKPELDDDVIDIYQEEYERDIERIGNDTNSFLNFVMFLSDKLGLPESDKQRVVQITRDLIIKEWEEWKEALKEAWKIISPFPPKR